MVLLPLHFVSGKAPLIYEDLFHKQIQTLNKALESLIKCRCINCRMKPQELFPGKVRFSEYENGAVLGWPQKNSLALFQEQKYNGRNPGNCGRGNNDK